MTFKQAEKRLLDMMKDDYCALEYERTYCRGGVLETICSIYVSSEQAYYRGATWDEAFNELDKELNPQNLIESLPEE